MTEQEKRDKVIKGLECCYADGTVPHCEECPYAEQDGTCYRIDSLLRDALALLKAQEPVKPVMCTAHAQGANDVWYECGKCGEFLGVNRHSQQFCAKCGMEVKW